MSSCCDCNKNITNKSKRCQQCHLKKLNSNHPNYKGGRHCIDCGIQIISHGIRRCKTCYGKYKSIYHVGKNNSNWKGGRSLLTVLPTNIRVQIFKRDNYTCQVCKIRGSRIDVHHKIPKELYSLNNLIESNKPFNLVTVCRKCHNWIHDKGIQRR